eukprot:3490989-Lingulodinium_polyedra.AAC.1
MPRKRRQRAAPALRQWARAPLRLAAPPGQGRGCLGQRCRGKRGRLCRNWLLALPHAIVLGASLLGGRSPASFQRARNGAGLRAVLHSFLQ